MTSKNPNPMKTETVTLPSRRVHKTPRLLMTDAYTFGSNDFESEKAKEKSTYYIVFRRELHKIDETLYTKGDNRMIFAGPQRILDDLFYEPVTHEEIDSTKEWAANFRVTNTGLRPYYFPEQIWRDVVDNWNGRPPIHIKGMPEGSVVYPGEPVMQITSMVKGWGILAAWFEEALLKVWAPSERITQNEHWFKLMRQMVLEVNPDLTPAEVNFFASLMLHDFGARAGICEREVEDLGMVHLYTFPGTDTCAGGYQAYMNSGKTPGLSVSVNALAHRNVQAYEREGDCYTALYNWAENNTINSYVADCYGYKPAVEKHLLPLALRSKNEGTGKIVVSRPDSGDALDQIIWTIELAIANGLYEEKVINGKTWKFGTYLKFIEGDGMTFAMMKLIIRAMMGKGFAPFGWGLFGVGGGLRNSLKRDNTGAKYALNAIGDDNEGVVKLSETLGKATLPGPLKVVRSADALINKTTVRFESEPGEDAMVEYYNGFRTTKPFGAGQDDDFVPIKTRIREQFDSMPLNLDTPHGAPASDAVVAERQRLVLKYAPEKAVVYGISTLKA